MHRQFRRPKPLPNINNAQSEMRWSAVPAGAKLTYISALIRRFMRHHLLLHARASSKYILSHFSCYVNIFILISIFYRKTGRESRRFAAIAPFFLPRKKAEK